MRDPTFQLLAAAGQLVPGLLWAVMARGHWNVLRNRRPRSTLFPLLVTVTAAIACRTIEAHQGRITAAKAAPSGLAVEITLPLAAGGRPS